MKWCGMPSGLSTSSSAPEAVRFRTVQSMAAPPNEINPGDLTEYTDANEPPLARGTPNWVRSNDNVKIDRVEQSSDLSSF